MLGGKVVCIDARMIEHSGIGTYIQHLMSNGIYDFAIGNEQIIRKYDKTVKIIPFEAKIYGLKEQLFFPAGKVRKANVNIVHFPHYNVPLFFNQKYIVTVHDLTHIVLPEFLGNKIKIEYAKALIKHALNKSEHIFTVSENSKNDIIDIFNVKNSKITVTYNAVDSDFFEKPKEQIDYLYDRFGIPRKKKVLLYVGNLKPHKNLSTLLKAVSQIKRGDIVLVLAGKAFKGESLEAQEKELNISDKVIHTGYVEKHELVDLYNLSDAFVFPSLYEGFGLPPLEAMACGTPVIASNNSSIPEVVGNAAVLVDARNAGQIAKAIIDVISNDTLKENLIKKGKDRAKLFQWPDMVSSVKDLIRNYKG